MALPVINNVFRVSFTFSSGGRTATNVIHVRRLSSTADDVWTSIKAIGDSSFEEGFNPWALMDNSYTIADMTVLKLDGTSAGVSGLPDDAWHGGSSGQELPAYAQIIHFGTAQRGPRGRGRVFVGPLTEVSVTDGLLDNTLRAAGVLNWINFADALDGDGMDLVVASYAHADFHEVTAISGPSVPGIQRRRNERLSV